jgi:hypothetical protein
MFSHHSRIALGAALLLSVVVDLAAACDVGFMPCGVARLYVPALAAANTPVEPETKLSWVFRRSTFTNDPVTGARVGQYARKDAVEPLEDQRLVTSSYRRMRSELRGRDGSMDTTYVVQGWGTGGGELGAEWQMFNDVWKEAILSGSFYNGEQAFGPWGSGRQQGWGGNPNWNNGWNQGWNGGWNGPGQGNWNRRRNDRDRWPSDDRAPLGGPNEPPANF